MLTERMRIYGDNSRVPRIAQLRELEGWYEIGKPMPLYLEYASAQSKLKFSRWLKDKKHFPDSEISKIVKQHEEQSNKKIKLSCRFNDIMRMSETRHFNSCAKARDFGCRTPGRICRDPRAAIIFLPDKSGKFFGRAVFRLMEDDTVQLMRCYNLNSNDLKELFRRLGFAVRSYVGWEGGQLAPTEEDTVEFYTRHRLDGKRV